MTLPALFRPAAAVVAAGLIAALVGCGGGKTEPSKPADPKPGDKKDNTSPGTTPSNPNPPTPPTPTGPQYIAPKDPAQAAAEKLQKDLRDGAVGTDRLTPAFLKVIGRPAVFDADKKQGYSPDEANKWLKRVGAGLPGLGIPTGFSDGGVAVFTTSLVGQPGQILLRLAQVNGTWKADWIQFAVVNATETQPKTGDEPFQFFALRAFLDGVASGPKAMDPKDRALVLGSVLSPKLKKSWAEPFGSDAAEGFDFNRGKLIAKADELGTGIEGYTFTPAGPDAFKVEVTRGGKKAGYTLKLVKGTAPGEWLVDEYTPQ
jgi:hypothetical protein